MSQAHLSIHAHLSIEEHLTLRHRPSDGRHASACRSRFGPSGELGAGSVLAVSVIAAILAALSLVTPLGIVLVARDRLAGAADAAALSGADVLVGLRPGDPCAAARRAAEANAATLTDCVVDGSTVTVQVGTEAAGFPVSMAATAGPPESLTLPSRRSQPPPGSSLVHHVL